MCRVQSQRDVQRSADGLLPSCCPAGRGTDVSHAAVSGASPPSPPERGRAAALTDPDGRSCVRRRRWSGSRLVCGFPQMIVLALNLRGGLDKPAELISF